MNLLLHQCSKFVKKLTGPEVFLKLALLHFELALLSLNWPLQNNATLIFSAPMLYSLIYCSCCGLLGYALPTFRCQARTAGSGSKSSTLGPYICMVIRSVSLLLNKRFLHSEQYVQDSALLFCLYVR